MSEYNHNYSIEEVEAILKKVGVRSRTFFTHKSRRLYDVLSDLAKRWHKYTDEEKEMINNLFFFHFDDKDKEKE